MKKISEMYGRRRTFLEISLDKSSKNKLFPIKKKLVTTNEALYLKYKITVLS